MKITRKCGHREDITTNPTPEGIEYLKTLTCGHCWRAARAKELPALAEAESMPACPSFKNGAEIKARKNREYFLLIYAQEVRPALWRATPAQQEATRAAMTQVLANTDSNWWELQTDPIQTLREAH